MTAAWTGQVITPEEIALGERAKHIGSEHTMRAMFLGAAVETVRREVGPEAASEVEAEVGMDTAKAGTMLKVPLGHFNRLQVACGKRLLPIYGSWELAVARIGGSAVEIFFESVAGRTMMLLAGKNPHRLMTAAPNGYPVAVADGGKRAYQKLGEREGIFTFEHDLVGPCHEAGTFSTAIKMVCDVEVEMRLQQNTLLDFQLHVSW